jgi:hypothetical protein
MISRILWFCIVVVPGVVFTTGDAWPVSAPIYSRVESVLIRTRVSGAEAEPRGVRRDEISEAARMILADGLKERTNLKIEAIRDNDSRQAQARTLLVLIDVSVNSLMEKREGEERIIALTISARRSESGIPSPFFLAAPRGAIIGRDAEKNKQVIVEMLQPLLVEFVVDPLKTADR